MDNIQQIINEVKKVIVGKEETIENITETSKATGESEEILKETSKMKALSSVKNPMEHNPLITHKYSE